MYIKMFYIKLLSLPHSELVVSLLLTVTTNLPQTLICSCILIIQGVAYRPIHSVALFAQ